MYRQRLNKRGPAIRNTKTDKSDVYIINVFYHNFDIVKRFWVAFLDVVAGLTCFLIYKCSGKYIFTDGFERGVFH